MPQLLTQEKAKYSLLSNKQKMSYKDIEECPTYNLTYQDMMSDPLSLFKRLESEFEEYGAIKLKASN